MTHHLAGIVERLRDVTIQSSYQPSLFSKEEGNKLNS